MELHGFYGILLIFYKILNVPLHVRYQPDTVFEKSKNKEGKEEVGESELTESESHLNMLKDGGITLRSLLNPPLMPTEQTSAAVNVAVIIIG